MIEPFDVSPENARAQTTQWGTALPEFVGVRVRYLSDNERPYAVQLPSVPLVVEAASNPSQVFLEAFLRENGDAVVRAIHDHGAVLFRGFQLTSERGFEAAVSSSSSFEPMGGYFFSEDGRSLVSPGSNVFHTNEIRRTGGGFRLPAQGFHTENYYSLDMPAFICFWCKQPPKVGGETAISQMCNAYSQLSELTRQRLESGAPCQVSFWSIDAVAQRYSLSCGAVRAMFEALGAPLVEESGRSYVTLAKSPVVQHPKRPRKSLLANMSRDLPAFNEAIARRFMPAYSSSRWLLYRAAWKRPATRQLGYVLTTLPLAFGSRRVMSYYLRAGWHRWTGQHPSDMGPKQYAEGPRLADKLTAEDVEGLADAMWRQSSVFTWRQGDLLILDNLQMAHTGMPGWGPRELRVMLCNSVRFPFKAERGVARVDTASGALSIHDRLNQLAVDGGGSSLHSHGVQR
jgi:hypothetical protein